MDPTLQQKRSPTKSGRIEFRKPGGVNQPLKKTRHHDVCWDFFKQNSQPTQPKTQNFCLGVMKALGKIAMAALESANGGANGI